MISPLPPGVRLFAGTRQYLQGPGALELLPAVAAPYGRRPLVIADAVVTGLLGDRLRNLLGAAGLRPDFRSLDGEITAATIDRLAAVATDAAPGVVIGVGGGKSLDAAKAVSVRLSLPVITVPSVASNDSPTSGAIAMYDDRHVLVAVDRMPANPVAVIVDTAVIVAAPVALLRSGLGDAIAKKYEAEACLAGTGNTPLGTRPLLTGIAIAQACYRTIRRHGPAGIRAAERSEITEDLEALVEAVILMSGLGFENGGLSLAHSLTRGLMPARGAAQATHGQHVAWALLVQRSVEGAGDDELCDLIGFLREVGLPVSLAELGMPDATTEEIRDIAQLTMTAPHLANLAVPVSAEAITGAIAAVDRLVAGT